MAGLKVHAFSGLRARSGKESGWSTGGTNAAFLVTVLRYFYGDQFDWHALQEFKQLNMIEDWEPRQDLLADGTLVGQGDGVIYFPDGFDSTGWDQIYSQWKSGKSMATLPAEPVVVQQVIAPPPPPPPAVDTSIDEWSFTSSPNSQAMTSTTPPAPATLPELPPVAPQPGAPSGPPPGSPVSAAAIMPAAQTAPLIPSTQKKGDSMLPWLLLGGGGLALLLMAGKKGKK